MRPVVTKSLWFVAMYLAGIVAMGTMALVIGAFLRV